MLRLFQRIGRKLLEGAHLKMLSSPRSIQFNLIYFKLTLIWFISLYPPLHHYTFAQELSIEQTEAEYKNLFGLDKLKALNSLSLYYYKQHSRKALKYGRQAVILGENIFVESNTNIDYNERHHQVQAYLQLGKVLYDRGSYFKSQKILRSNLKLSLDSQMKKRRFLRSY